MCSNMSLPPIHTKRTELQIPIKPQKQTKNRLITTNEPSIHPSNKKENHSAQPSTSIYLLSFNDAIFQILFCAQSSQRMCLLFQHFDNENTRTKTHKPQTIFCFTKISSPFDDCNVTYQLYPPHPRTTGNKLRKPARHRREGPPLHQRSILSKS